MSAVTRGILLTKDTSASDKDWLETNKQEAGAHRAHRSPRFTVKSFLKRNWDHVVVVLLHLKFGAVVSVSELWVYTSNTLIILINTHTTLEHEYYYYFSGMTHLFGSALDPSPLILSLLIRYFNFLKSWLNMYLTRWNNSRRWLTLTQLIFHKQLNSKSWRSGFLTITMISRSIFPCKGEHIWQEFTVQSWIHASR